MGGGKANNWNLDKGDLVMVLNVLLRNAMTDAVDEGVAYTGPDAPSGWTAMCDWMGEPVPPESNLVVRVLPIFHYHSLLELLNAGYAVEIVGRV